MTAYGFRTRHTGCAVAQSGSRTKEETQMKVRKLAYAATLLVSAVGLSGAAFANAEIEKRSQDHNWWSVPGQNNKLHPHSQ